MKLRLLVALSIGLGVLPLRAGAYCTGDCDANGTVSTTEAVDCRGIAFGSRPLSQCPQCDCDQNGIVSDPEFMRAEQNASASCVASECPSATGTPGLTPTGTPTPTSSIPTRTRTPTSPLTNGSPTATQSTSATTTPVAGSCVGDCDNSGSVNVNEVVTGVNINLDRAAVNTCPSFDPNATTTVSVDELVRGVNNLLGGCP